MSSPPQKKFRAGIIGLGVGNRHCDAYAESGIAEPVAVCDLDRDKCRDVQERHPGIRIYDSANELLDDPGIDVVSIASYDDTHGSYAVRAIEASKHVYVEKPLCLSQTELTKVQDALNRFPNVQLSSNLILRTNPRFIRLRQDIAEGDYGKLYLVEADYHYGRLHKLTGGWRGDLPFYSVIHGGMIHLLDLVRWLVPSRPVSVQAVGNSISTIDTKFQFPDCVVALIKFESGMILKSSANFGCVKPHYHALSVFGTEATFQNDLPSARIYRSRDPAQTFELDSTDYLHVNKGSLLVDFISALANGTQPTITAQDTIETMRLSLTVQEALETGKEIYLPR